MREPANCYNNLRLLDGAKAQYVYEHHATNGTVVTEAELMEYLPKYHWPKCPKGGDYSIGKIGESPRCSYTAHSDYKVPD